MSDTSSTAIDAIGRIAVRTPLDVFFSVMIVLALLAAVMLVVISVVRVRTLSRPGARRRIDRERRGAWSRTRRRAALGVVLIAVGGPTTVGKIASARADLVASMCDSLAADIESGRIAAPTAADERRRAELCEVR